MISITLIGAGNIAQHLFKALNERPEIKLVQWFNRNLERITSYKNEVEITNDLYNLKSADIYIIAISDDAIADISSSLPFKDRLVVHTSGSVNIHDLDKKNRRGVFYPLQSFSHNQNIRLKDAPICLEALEKNDLQILKKLAKYLDCDYYKISTEQRLTLHLSAVFVNNFVNQLYRIGHEISDAKNINFNILKPLINETARKINEISPYQAQTGPAVRNDKKTIKKHLKMLENSYHRKIYQLLTTSIKSTHGK